MLHFAVSLPVSMFCVVDPKDVMNVFPPPCPHIRALGNPLRVFCCFSFIWLPSLESPIVPALLAPHLANLLFWGGEKASSDVLSPLNSTLFFPLSLTCFAGLSRAKAAEMIRLWRRAFQPRLPPNWFPVTWLRRRKVSFNSCVLKYVKITYLLLWVS